MNVNSSQIQASPSIKFSYATQCGDASHSVRSPRSVTRVSETNRRHITSRYPSAAVHEELHNQWGKYIKSILYGGLDGVVSVFVAVAAVTGADKGVGVLFVLALAKLLSGGISMGVGDWLSTQASVDYAKGERKREKWECENYLEGEKKEMVEIYTERGLRPETARRLVELLSKNENTFVDIMMIEELGILPEDEQQIPWKHGLTNFASFIVCGLIPLLSFIAYMVIGKYTRWIPSHSLHGESAFFVSVGVSLATLFFMGIFKGKVTNTPWWKAGPTTLLLGAVSGATGFGVGYGLEKLL